MARIVIIRHYEEDDEDRVMTFFHDKGLEPEIVRPFKGETLRSVDGSLVASIVMGGPFNVFDEDKHPFLVEEKRWIEQCFKHDFPLLGICQGAQMIADVLGASVGPLPGEPGEFGYYEITATEAGKAHFPEKLYVTEAHFHHFDLPRGAVLLAESQLFPHQAFQYGPKIFGFQFHAEVTPAMFRRWQSKPGSFDRPGAQTCKEQNRLMTIHDPAQHNWFMQFQENFFGEALYHTFSEKQSTAQSDDLTRR